MQYEFREHFRNSILSNHHASFNVHWTKARSKQFGNDCPMNVTSFHDIFMDRIRKKFYYWKSKLPESQNAYIKHMLPNGETINEQFIHEYDKLRIYCLPSQLNLLNRYPTTGDGTWAPVRYIAAKQCYILCANITEGNKVLTVPVLYALCKNFTTRTYNSIFEFCKLKHLEFFGEDLVISEFHLDCEIGVLNSVRLNFPNCIILYCNVHILRNISKHFKKHLGPHFFNTKIFLEFFKLIAGSFYLDFSNKELKNEFFLIMESFPSRAGRFNSSFKKDINKVIKYLKNNYFGHQARFPAKFWNYRDLALKEKFQFSTNAIESLNRSIK